MNKNVTIDSAIDLLVFSKTQNIKDLMAHITDFFAQHIDEIFLSDTNNDSFNSLFNLKLSLEK